LLLEIIPKLPQLYSRDDLEERTRGWAVVADDETAGLARRALAQKNCPVHTAGRFPYTFHDSLGAFLCHGDPHLEQWARAYFRMEGRGALVLGHSPDCFSLSYVTLERMLAGHWTALIPAVEQYDPSREYVYVFSLDDDEIRKIIRF